MDTDYQELVKLGVAANRAERLIQSELPWWRKKRRRVGRQWPHLEVGGDCLRIGKTTTKQVLAEQIGKRGWPLVFSDEDWKDNPYLKRAYAGSAASLLNSQLWFAKKKRSQLTNISDSSFWIQVVNPEMDWAYAMTNFLSGNLSERQWLRYWREYQALGWE